MSSHLSFKDREEFQKRLKKSLQSVGINPNSPTQLLLSFKSTSKESEISIGAVYRWLQGDALPTPHNMEVLAQICKVCPYWLRTGLLKNDEY